MNNELTRLTSCKITIYYVEIVPEKKKKKKKKKLFSLETGIVTTSPTINILISQRPRKCEESDHDN
jgi:hypothetical protein